VDIQNRDPEADTSGAPLSPTRRRFASAGVKTSGVILTLVSSPGMAQSMCKSPSGALSGNLKSHAGNQTVVCGGKSPGYWKNAPEAWPLGVYPVSDPQHGIVATTFASVFPFGWTSLYQTGSMMDVLNDTDPKQDTYNLGAHLVSAYLNVVTKKISFLTTNGLIGIWHDLCTYGYYSPSAGVKWYPEDVANYLSKTEG
jgi:hypothetical protein